jgi:hypothetical protein
LADLRACVKHFEQTASDGGDPKRKARNEQTLEKLKVILKDVEGKIAGTLSLSPRPLVSFWTPDRPREKDRGAPGGKGRAVE